MSAVSCGTYVGVSFERFGPFPIPTCVEKLSMFLPILKSIAALLQPEEYLQQALHRQTDGNT